MRVFRRKGSEKWWADCHAGGRRHRASMETADKREAEKKARAWEAGLQEKCPVSGGPMMLSMAIRSFIDDECTPNGLARRTVSGYRATLARFLEWNGDENVGAWSHSDALDKVDGFLRRRTGEVGRLALKRDRVTLGTLFNYMRRRRWFNGGNPADAKLHDLRQPRRTGVRPERRTTPEEDLILRREGQKSRLWPVLLLTRWAGMRRGEACTVLWSEVNLEEGYLVVSGHEGGRKHARMFYLHPWVVMQLRTMRPEWLPEDGKVPVWPYHPDSATAMFREFCDGHLKRRIEFNDLRASFATDCYERGMTAEQESRYAGHSVEVAEKHYLDYKAKEARSKLPPDPLTERAADAESDAEVKANVAQ